MRRACIVEGDWQTQSWLLSREDVEPCVRDGEATLCPITERGRRDLEALRRRGRIVHLEGYPPDYFALEE